MGAYSYYDFAVRQLGTDTIPLTPKDRPRAWINAANLPEGAELKKLFDNGECAVVAEVTDNTEHGDGFALVFRANVRRADLPHEQEKKTFLFGVELTVAQAETLAAALKAGAVLRRRHERDAAQSALCPPKTAREERVASLEESVRIGILRAEIEELGATLAQTAAENRALRYERLSGQAELKTLATKYDALLAKVASENNRANRGKAKKR